MGWVSREEHTPLSEPECAPYIFLSGGSIEIKDGLLYFVGWQTCNGCGPEERRIIARWVLPLAVAIELDKEFNKALISSRKTGH